jgi:TetR/AcrR family transcriptional repressor of nem operon
MSTADRILDAAERRMRHGGYNAVSFRDLAADVGVKSASVHYHFPQKHDLGVALVQRYARRFAAAIDATSDASPIERLTAFIDLYRQALAIDSTICLCCMLGAESMGLPAEVRAEVDAFFRFNVALLTPIFAAAGHPQVDEAASCAVSGLQGAMLVASTPRNRETFEIMARSVLRSLSAKG